MPRPEVTRVLIVALVTTSLAFSCARSPSPTPSPSSPLTPVETPSATEPTPTVTTPAPTVTTPAPTVTTPATSKPATSKPATTKPATTPTVVPTVPASLRGQDVEQIPTTARVVALTFDAGANADGLASILATLDSEQVPATFFLTGTFCARYPDAVREIVARGHRLGNHTATHPHLTGLSDAAIVNELAQAEAQILAAGGTDPRPLFRFPYGDRNAHVIAVVNDAGYVAVRWTVDTLGWQGTRLGGITADVVVDRVVQAARPGEIVLMHIGSNPDDQTTLDADALPTVIARLRTLGYEFVTLDALLTAA